jgi:hypothetical protein
MWNCELHLIKGKTMNNPAELVGEESIGIAEDL